MRIGIAAVAGLMAVGVAHAQQASVVTVGPPVTLGQTQAAAPTISADLMKKLDAAMAASIAAECPGAFSARQQGVGGGTVWTTALEDRGITGNGRPTGLAVHVEFEHTASLVTALELRVSYLPLGLHRMGVAPVMMDTAANQPTEREKSFNLDREAAKRIDADLLVGPAATITRVYLVSVTYADGTVWNAPAGNACSVVPSRMMLIAAR